MGLAEQISGVAVPRLMAPPWLLAAMSRLMGVAERVVAVPDYGSEYLRVSAGVTYLGGNAKARDELGWVPRPLWDGLVETLHHEMTLLGMR
jgi:nucleoside-diphosphate-sugar epimerase